MTKMKKTLALLLAAVMLIGVLAACGTEEEAAIQATEGASITATTAEGEVVDAQVMNVRTTSFGNNYDVQDMGWRWMMADCYEGLYRNVADEDGEHFILAGAESVEVSEDGTVYTFHLRQDAKWSDGVAVTAHDYEYGWKRLGTPSTLTTTLPLSTMLSVRRSTTRAKALPTM